MQGRTELYEKWVELLNKMGGVSCKSRWSCIDLHEKWVELLYKIGGVS